VRHASSTPPVRRLPLVAFLSGAKLIHNGDAYFLYILFPPHDAELLSHLFLTSHSFLSYFFAARCVLSFKRTSNRHYFLYTLTYSIYCDISSIMKFTSFVVGAALSSSVIAFPGMAGNKKMMDFHKGLTRRALTPNLKPRGGMFNSVEAQLPQTFVANIYLQSRTTVSSRTQ